MDKQENIERNSENNRDINLVINETKENVFNLLNKTNLPISILGLMVREIASMVSEQEKAVLQQLKNKTEN